MRRSRVTRLGRAALLLPMLLASACAGVPDLGAKPVLAPPSNYVSTQSLKAAQSPWPVEGWWKAYSDPQLDALIGEALRGSPDLDAAAARLRTAQGLDQQAGSALLPSIDLEASVDEQKSSRNAAGPQLPVPDGWRATGNAALGFNLDLDFFGKNRAALRAADRDADAARFDTDEARLLLTTAIASTYADLASLYAQRDNLKAALDIRGETLKFVRGRFEAGLETIDTVRQAEARIPQSRSDIAATDEAIMLDKHALAALAGEGPDRALTIGRPAVSGLHAQGIPADASINLIGRRPDVAAARARVEAAGERIKQARAAFYPDINIGALVGLQSLGLGRFFSKGSKFASATPALTLPLFEGGALQSQYRVRGGQYDEAVASYDGKVIQALRETADTLASQRQLAERLSQSRIALADYEAALKVAQGRYQQGLTNYLTVLTAEESVVGARLTVAQLQSRTVTLDVELVRSLGGGFHAASDIYSER